MLCAAADLDENATGSYRELPAHYPFQDIRNRSTVHLLRPNLKNK
jgi:hypothetical protein